MKKRYSLPLLILSLLLSVAIVSAGTITRKVVNVPKVDAGAIHIDGKMTESAWTNAAHADLITASGYEIWASKYSREGLTEPEFDELYGRMLWADDTLYVFIHIKEIVNDSTNLFFSGNGYPGTGSHWASDQLYIGISNRLGIPTMEGWEGAPWNAPNGPYHLMIMGNRVTFNDNDSVWIPEAYRDTITYSMHPFKASDIVRSGVTIDTLTGLWDVELAIYNPNITSQASIGFNIGGSTSSRKAFIEAGDSYGYYVWQPNILNDPWGDATGANWNSYYIQQNSEYWAVLNFTPGVTDTITRRVVKVPRVDTSIIVIDGLMNEKEWKGAAHADLITASGYDIWASKYSREGLTEPEFDELYGRMLWNYDTLYVFMHIKEIVNDSTNLFFSGNNYPGTGSHWASDQLYLGLSNRLGIVTMDGWEGAPWNAPNGPYHLMVMGKYVTFNDGDTVWIPEKYRKTIYQDNKVYNAGEIVRSAARIDTLTGLWDVEMAIYHPNVAAQASIGFNIGGSTSSRKAFIEAGDSYGYYVWQPNVANDPWGDATGANWNSYYIQQNSKYWALLNFDPAFVTAVDEYTGATVPDAFTLEQNYPNPFNPSTTVSYTVPHLSKVVLHVYNMLGQQVATLFEGARAPGRYEAKWNAAKMGSGVYFLQMRADGQVVASKKMMLLK